MFNIIKFLPMIGFEPWTSGIGGDQSRPLFLYFLSFQYSFKTADGKWSLPMTWFEPRTSDVGSDHSWILLSVSYSVTIFGDFWKILATIFLAKVAEIICHFLTIFKHYFLTKNCIFGNFWKYFGYFLFQHLVKLASSILIQSNN